MKRWLPWAIAGAAVLAIGRVRFQGGRVWLRVHGRRVVSVEPPITEEAEWLPLDAPSRRYLESGSGFVPVG